MSSSSAMRAARCGAGGSRGGLGGPPLVCRASACTAACPCTHQRALEELVAYTHSSAVDEQREVIDWTLRQAICRACFVRACVRIELLDLSCADLSKA